MGTSKIFAISVEETDGKLVIALDGSVAAGVAQRLRERIEAGRGVDLLRQFLPLRGLTKLLLSSPLVSIARPSGSDSSATASQDNLEPMTVAQIFNQGFESGLQGFEQQMTDFEASLGAVEAQMGLGPENVVPKKNKKG